MLKELQIGLNFFRKLFEWIRNRYEKTLPYKRLYENIALNHLPLSKYKIVISLRAIIHEFFEFFQEKFNPIRSD